MGLSQNTPIPMSLPTAESCSTCTGEQFLFHDPKQHTVFQQTALLCRGFYSVLRGGGRPLRVSCPLQSHDLWLFFIIIIIKILYDGAVGIQ